MAASRSNTNKYSADGADDHGGPTVVVASKKVAIAPGVIAPPVWSLIVWGGKKPFTRHHVC